jgi:anthranilate/para-aminobenzoate synthase component I
MDWTWRPLDVAAAWPDDRPLVMLHSARPHPRWARWSILAHPSAVYRFDGRRSILTGRLPQRPAAFAHDPLADMQALIDSTRASSESDQRPEIPFAGGWIGVLSYDLGRVIEPRAQHPHPDLEVDPWPLIELCYCADALVYDNVSGAWHAVGDGAADGALRGDAGLLEEFSCGELSSSFTRPQYLAAAQSAIDYIREGDIFQANITQRLRCSFEGSARRLALQSLRESGSWYGAYLELPRLAEAEPDRCVISLSPELLLQIDERSRAIVTRPIKGTRPARTTPLELLESAKDAAELHMIVDLMRNDLGRVCEFGSVRVPCPRAIETHPTVHHGVGEIVGRLRRDVSLAEVIRAAFPGGSVTGAPKIRAMQIIDEIEPQRRGPYCGSIGYVSDCGRACLNIAIRTMLLSGRGRPGRCGHLAGTLDYGAGGGIVADSQPVAEYRECMDKAAVLRAALSRERAPAAL